MLPTMDTGFIDRKYKQVLNQTGRKGENRLKKEINRLLHETEPLIT